MKSMKKKIKRLFPNQIKYCPGDASHGTSNRESITTASYKSMGNEFLLLDDIGADASSSKRLESQPPSAIAVSTKPASKKSTSSSSSSSSSSIILSPETSRSIQKSQRSRKEKPVLDATSSCDGSIPEKSPLWKGYLKERIRKSSSNSSIESNPCNNEVSTSRKRKPEKEKNNKQTISSTDTCKPIPPVRKSIDSSSSQRYNKHEVNRPGSHKAIGEKKMSRQRLPTPQLDQSEKRSISSSEESDVKPSRVRRPTPQFDQFEKLSNMSIETTSSSDESEKYKALKSRRRTNSSEVFEETPLKIQNPPSANIRTLTDSSESLHRIKHQPLISKSISSTSSSDEYKEKHIKSPNLAFPKSRALSSKSDTSEKKTQISSSKSVHDTSSSDECGEVCVTSSYAPVPISRVLASKSDTYVTPLVKEPQLSSSKFIHGTSSSDESGEVSAGSSYTPAPKSRDRASKSESSEKLFVKEKQPAFSKTICDTSSSDESSHAFVKSSQLSAFKSRFVTSKSDTTEKVMLNETRTSVSKTIRDTSSSEESEEVCVKTSNPPAPKSRDFTSKLDISENLTMKKTQLCVTKTIRDTSSSDSSEEVGVTSSHQPFPKSGYSENPIELSVSTSFSYVNVSSESEEVHRKLKHSPISKSEALTSSSDEADKVHVKKTRPSHSKSNSYTSSSDGSEEMNRKVRHPLTQKSRKISSSSDDSGKKTRASISKSMSHTSSSDESTKVDRRILHSPIPNSNTFMSSSDDSGKLHVKKTHLPVSKSRKYSNSSDKYEVHTNIQKLPLDKSPCDTSSSDETEDPQSPKSRKINITSEGAKDLLSPGIVRSRNITSSLDKDMLYVVGPHSPNPNNIPSNKLEQTVTEKPHQLIPQGRVLDTSKTTQHVDSSDILKRGNVTSSSDEQDITVGFYPNLETMSTSGFSNESKKREKTEPLVLPSSKKSQTTNVFGEIQMQLPSRVNASHKCMSSESKEKPSSISSSESEDERKGKQPRRTSDYSSTSSSSDEHAMAEMFVSTNSSQRQRTKSSSSEEHAPIPLVSSQLSNDSKIMRGMLKESMSSNLFLRGLTELQKEQLFEEMFLMNVKSGEVILRQGDEADFFYIIEMGSVAVHINERRISVVGAGSTFGELAFICRQPRAATIIAHTDVTLWCVNGTAYNRIILNMTVSKRQKYEQRLAEIPFLACLDEYELLTLADAVQTAEFYPGELVLQQGEKGRDMYIILEGEAKVIQAQEYGARPIQINTLYKNDYFGELALVFDQNRAASVIASSYLVCVKLDNLQFERILGNYKEILKRNASRYEIAMH